MCPWQQEVRTTVTTLITFGRALRACYFRGRCYLRRHNILMLLSGDRYFPRVVTFRILRIFPTFHISPPKMASWENKFYPLLLARSEENPAGRRRSTPLYRLYRHVRPKEYGFSAVLVINRVWFLYSSWTGHVFLEDSRSFFSSLSIRHQQNTFINVFGATVQTAAVKNRISNKFCSGHT